MAWWITGEIAEHIVAELAPRDRIINGSQLSLQMIERQHRQAARLGGEQTIIGDARQGLDALALVGV